MRAIDLYSGVGGWGLGLRLAGVNVVSSYEISEAAVETQAVNLGHRPEKVDIRSLDFESLPKDIDVVVGSPPCTQFSFSNRGGSGDLLDGLKDVRKFLEVVEFLKPRYWVMENVPRLSGILSEQVFGRRGRLKQFSHLFENGKADIRIVDMSAYGLPQRRIRCIVGSIPFDLLESYRDVVPPLVMDDVIRGLYSRTPRDELYGVQLSRRDLSDAEIEEPLSEEELRMNRDSKQNHPIYNSMSFPDSLLLPSRTIAATCTRVSRESIVIYDKYFSKSIRRLSLREKALMQGFPIHFQFLGRSLGEKSRLVGNALPPPFAYLVGCSLKKIKPEALVSIKDRSKALELPSACALRTRTDRSGSSYNVARRFRATIPNLRFKSGVRFELGNNFDGASVCWTIRFFFGSSKMIHEVEVDGSLKQRIGRFKLGRLLTMAIERKWAAFERVHAGLSSADLQAVWCRRSEGPSPYLIVDTLGDLVGELIDEFQPDYVDEARKIVGRLLEGDALTAGLAKVQRNALAVLVGLLVACKFNLWLTDFELRLDEAA